MQETIPIFAAALSAIAALAVVLYESRHQRKRERRATTAERLAKFSAAVHAAVVRISGLASEPQHKKDQVRRSIMLEPTDTLNELLSAIILLDSSVVVRLALEIDEALSDLERKAGESEWSSNEWLRQRAVVSRLVTKFHQASREELGSTDLADQLPPLVASQ